LSFIFLSLYCLSFCRLSFCHCIVCPFSIHGFWLPLWYLLTIVLSVFFRFTASDYPFGIFWPLYCQSSFDSRLLITPLVYFDHCIVSLLSIHGFWLPLWYILTIVVSVFFRFTASDYPFGIFTLFLDMLLYCSCLCHSSCLLLCMVFFGSKWLHESTFICLSNKNVLELPLVIQFVIKENWWRQGSHYPV
jgi:hypothetical protein